MKDTVSTKEAVFMLDTDMEQDMKSYGDEVTSLAIKYINSTPKLYNQVKKYGNAEQVAREWAGSHNEEFGPLFVTELEMVNWDKVRRMV